MHEHASRPIEEERRIEVHSVSSERPGAPKGIVLDGKALLHRACGDGEAAREIIETFLDDEPRLLEDLMVAVSRSNAEAIFRSAHRLKGALQSLGAVAASTAASQLEEMGHRGELTGLQDAWIALEHAMRRFDGELDTLRRDLVARKEEESS